MSPAYQRGILLLQQGRHELADREFRRDLADDPDNPVSHAYLALCLIRGKRLDEALVEADEAVRCAPDLAFSHYARAAALHAKDRLKEAETAIQEAIRLDPEDADYPSVLAAIAMDRREWKAALEAADRGLALDPEHAICRNYRGMALVQLGRKDEASATLGSALADDPENGFTHANQGWALLHKGDHKQALVHFREALRIEPDMEWARVGIIEALKARFLIYRGMLAFFLWMGRQSSVARWVVILGIVFGRQILAAVARSAPALQPLITPILALSFAFLLMTWISSPLFNIALMFNPFGRMALSREQKVQSGWIGGCLFLALVMFLAYVIAGAYLFLLLTGYFGMLLFPLAVTFRLEHGRPRLLGTAYTAALATFGAVIFARLVTGPNGPLARLVDPSALILWFIGGSALSTWLGGFLGRRALAD